jgi:hypothetical protein
MTIDFTLDNFKSLISYLIQKINYAKHIGQIAEIRPELNDLYDQVLLEISELKKVIEKQSLRINYIKQLTEATRRIDSGFPSGPNQNVQIESYTLLETEKPLFKQQLEGYEIEIRKAFEKFRLTFSFFSSLNFLNNNIVVIGSNGSGKTLLADNLKSQIENNGVVISAQRVLVVPVINEIQSPPSAAANLKSAQNANKTNKDYALNDDIQQEFKFLLAGIIADNAASNNELKKELRNGPINEIPTTRLEKLIMIWNSLFKHRTIACEDGINISVHSSSRVYHSSQMSEGEKVVLYLVAHTLLTPLDGFIIVDEPEMHLHPTIHRKLWDILEMERPDCIFIYFTHDLDFAASRAHSKKLWLRSFEFPSSFQMEEIPMNEIPPALLFELLGSRQNIMFCEGQVGSLDEKMYSLIFPDYIIKPVGGCLAVINYTKAFNKIPNLPTKAVGIIDSDYHSKERLRTLESSNIFSIGVAEVENLLLSEVLLEMINKHLQNREVNIQSIKSSVLGKLDKERKTQIANYVLTKINTYFNDSHIGKGGDISQLKDNFDAFIAKVEIDKWADERSIKIDKILLDKNYKGAIQILKDKGGLLAIANSHFKIKDFVGRSLKLLGRNAHLSARLREEYFPQQLNEINKKK